MPLRFDAVVGSRVRPWARCAVAALAVLAAGCGGHGANTTAGRTRQPASNQSAAAATPTPTTAATSPGPATTTLPAGFVPASVSFVDADLGFALGGSPCAGPGSGLCNELARTTDGGMHWRQLTAPTTSIIDPYQRGELRFADALDGWAGGDGLESTHDGGETWEPVSLPGLSTPDVAAITVGNGLVEVLAGESTGSDTPPAQLRLWRSPVQFDAFTAAPGVSLPGTATEALTVGSAPAQNHPAAALEASDDATGQGWLVSSDGHRTPELWTSPDGEVWTRSPQPCAGGDLASAATVPAPTSTSTTAPTAVLPRPPAPPTVVLVCQAPAAGGQSAKVVWTSADNGRHWVVASAATAAVRLAAGYLAAVLAPAAGADVLATSSTSDWLLHSTDGGRSWSVSYVSNVNGVGQGLYDLNFTDSEHGVVLLGNAGVYAAERVDKRGDIPPPRVLVTADGGQHWTSVLVRR